MVTRSWNLNINLYTIPGFGLLEAGVVSSKNEVNIMVKNVCDVVFGGLSYWAFGYALTFGDSEWSNPFCGIGKFFVHSDNIEEMGLLYSNFIFQVRELSSIYSTFFTIINELHECWLPWHVFIIIFTLYLPCIFLVLFYISFYLLSTYNISNY